MGYIKKGFNGYFKDIKGNLECKNIKTGYNYSNFNSYIFVHAR